tara:strand:+ start:5217 stop:6458 length:1242 start_codon:yes stop_codon:yes gene_type:complete
MGIFGKGKKDKADAKPRGLGRSTSPAGKEDDGELMIVDAVDDLDDDTVMGEPQERGLSDEIMEIDRMDRHEIDEELAARPDKPKKRGLFGGKAKPAKSSPAERSGPVAEDEVKKAKSAKKPSKRSKDKAKKEADEARELATRLSVLVEIEELPGVTKEDAIDTARHQALNHSERPSNCYFNVLKTRSGYLIEVQEGVGRSYLPSVYQLAMDNPGRVIVVPMVRRKMTVVYSPRTDSFDAQILGEDVEAPEVNGEKPLMAKRGPAMTPVFKQYQQWFLTGMITAGIGAVALLSSLAFYAFDPDAKVPPQWRTTNVGQLPVMQWNQLSGGSSDSYVVRLEYQDGQWRVVRQTTFAQVEVNAVDDSTGGQQITGGRIEGPGAPDANGQPSAPGPQPAPQPQPQPGQPELPAGMTQP